jgi:hypothetical protein
LSRNVGHQNALLAGLLAQIGKADAVISLDADLQDDMSVVAPFARSARATAGSNAVQPTFTTAFSIGSARISFRITLTSA